MTSGLKSRRARLRAGRGRQRLDVDGVVVVGRRDPHRRLEAHARERAEDLVADGCRGRRAVLRVKRKHQQPLATASSELRDPRCDRRIAVAHRPVDDDVRAQSLQRARKLLGLRAGDGLERRFVPLLVPDLAVVARLPPRPGAQDDAVEHDAPERTLVLDHPRIGEKFLEIAAHRRRIGRVRSAEIDQQHADLAGRHRRRGLRGKLGGRGLGYG